LSTYPTLAAGQRLTAGMLRAMQTNVLTKSATETVTSSTTLQDDDELVVPVDANATYVMTFHLALGSVAAADVNTEYTVPAGASGFKWCQGPPPASTDRENTTMVSAVHNFGTDRRYGPTSTTSVPAVIEHLLVNTSSTAGNVVFRWAQDTSNATGSVNLAGAFVTWVRVA
jgi:hypothetical protein